MLIPSMHEFSKETDISISTYFQARNYDVRELSNASVSRISKDPLRHVNLYICFVSVRCITRPTYFNEVGTEELYARVEAQAEPFEYGMRLQKSA